MRLVTSPTMGMGKACITQKACCHLGDGSGSGQDRRSRLSREHAYALGHVCCCLAWWGSGRGPFRARVKLQAKSVGLAGAPVAGVGAVERGIIFPLPPRERTRGGVKRPRGFTFNP